MCIVRVMNFLSFSRNSRPINKQNNLMFYNYFMSLVNLKFIHYKIFWVGVKCAQRDIFFTKTLLHGFNFEQRVIFALRQFCMVEI